MTALVTTAQLASRLHLASVDSSGQDAVNHASGLVRAIGRQQYSFVSQETIELRGGERVLRIPERPLVVDGSNPLTVVEVGEFGSIDLTLVEDRDFERIGNELKRGYPWWWNSSQRTMGYPRVRPTGVFAPKVRVTYSHGYQTVPDDIVSVVLDVAAVLYDNPTSLRSFAIDDYSETKANEVLGASLTASIAEKLGATGRKRRAFSIRTA